MGFKSALHMHWYTVEPFSSAVLRCLKTVYSTMSRQLAGNQRTQVALFFRSLSLYIKYWWWVLITHSTNCLADFCIKSGVHSIVLVLNWGWMLLFAWQVTRVIHSTTNQTSAVNKCYVFLTCLLLIDLLNVIYYTMKTENRCPFPNVGWVVHEMYLKWNLQQVLGNTHVQRWTFSKWGNFIPALHWHLLFLTSGHDGSLYRTA